MDKERTVKTPKWVSELDDYHELLHRNAIDLNFRPTSEKLYYRLPSWISDTIVDLNGSGNTQYKILIYALVNVSTDFDKIKEVSKKVVSSYEQDEFVHDVEQFQDKMEELSKIINSFQ